MQTGFHFRVAGAAAAQVAEARSDETFVALCLLTVTGASLLTQKLGFSDTMGAFVAGVLLAETNYSTQVRPSGRAACALAREPPCLLQPLHDRLKTVTPKR